MTKCAELTLATKQITPCERALKIMPENGVSSCVPFCLRSLGRFERCEVSNRAIKMAKKQCACDLYKKSHARSSKRRQERLVAYKG